MLLPREQFQVTAKSKGDAENLCTAPALTSLSLRVPSFRQVTFGVVHSVHLDKRVMTRVPYHSLPQSSFPPWKSSGLCLSSRAPSAPVVLLESLRVPVRLLQRGPLPGRGRLLTVGKHTGSRGQVVTNTGS